MPKGIFVVQSAPTAPDQEAEYNDWYDNSHIPELLAIDGFRAARRYKLMGDDDGAAAHPYLAVYDIEAEDLTAPLQELRRLQGEGRTTGTTALRLDPPPVTTLYEVVDPAR